MSNDTAITIRQTEQPTLAESIDLATRLSDSALLPEALRKKPADVLFTVLAGRELGLPAVASLRGISIIEGKPSINADLLVALCLRRTELCDYFDCIESTTERATYETKRRGRPARRMTFTAEDAKQAELLGKKNWRVARADMLRHRAASKLARSVYPDIVGGVYDPDEMTDIAERPAPAAVDAEAEADDFVDAEVIQSDTSASDRLRAAIAEASDLAALKALVAEIKTLPAEAHAELRAAYSARTAELKGAK